MISDPWTCTLSPGFTTAPFKNLTCADNSSNRCEIVTSQGAVSLLLVINPMFVVPYKRGSVDQLGESSDVVLAVADQLD